MNIGIIAHLKHPIRKPYMGGLEAYTYSVTQALIQQGHNVTLYASEHSDTSLNVYPIMSDIDYDRETLSRFRSHELSEDFISTHHAYLELMQDIDGRGHDVIFNNSLNYVPITMASMLTTPMVTVLHTPPIFEMKRAMQYEKKYNKIKYISVSEPNAKAWMPYISNCSVIPNGIDISLWRYYDKPGGDYVFWFGRIHPDKGTHLAIEAAQKAGYRIKIAGSVADHYYYETYVEPLLDDSVDLLGNCTHEELNVLIGNAKACIITPCWDEPFGLVVAESLACGTPVAGIARGALPYILDEYTGALTPSADAHQLAGCIEKAIGLDRLKCRTRAEESLSLSRMVDAYLKVFTEMVKERTTLYAV